MSPSTQRSKMTDFQKWQVEQDESRNERLKKHSRMQNDSDEENIHEGDDDEILSKQQELMEKIQRQKDELERMRREREQEEVMVSRNRGFIARLDIKLKTLHRDLTSLVHSI